MQKLMRVLRKLYRYDNSHYDDERRVALYRTDTLSEKEQQLLLQSGWMPDNIIGFTGHADILSHLHSLKAHPQLSRRRCTEAFVAGVSSSYLRGRSVLSAFHQLHSLPDHAYLEKPQYACCWICGDHDTGKYINDSYLQYCLYAGNSYSSTPLYAYLNLRHLLTTEPVAPTEEDKIRFRQLLAMLSDTPADETPGQFEKRLKAAKLIPGDRYTLRGILQTLALIGVLPNPFVPLSLGRWTDFGDITIAEKQLNNTKGRSDMEMPRAGWKGVLRTDNDKVTEYFGDYLC